MNTGKTIALTRWTFVSKVISLLFNTLYNLIIAFLPRSKPLLISWLQSPSAVILESKKQKVCHCFHCFPIYLPWNDGTGCMILVLWMLSFKPTFSLSSFTFFKRLFSSSAPSANISFRIDWFYLLAIQGALKSLLQHHSSKASTLCHSTFFMVQLSHPYMATGLWLYRLLSVK